MKNGLSVKLAGCYILVCLYYLLLVVPPFSISLGAASHIANMMTAPNNLTSRRDVTGRSDFSTPLPKAEVARETRGRETDKRDDEMGGQR